MKEGQAAVKKHRENETEDREKKRRIARRNGVSLPPLGFRSRVRPRVLPPPRWRRWRRRSSRRRRAARLSEELIPLNTLRAFYRKHHSTASMPVQYPDSTVVKETLPLRVVQAYCRELRGRTLPALGSRCAAMFGGIIGAQVIGQ